MPGFKFNVQYSHIGSEVSERTTGWRVGHPEATILATISMHSNVVGFYNRIHFFNPEPPPRTYLGNHFNTVRFIVDAYYFSLQVTKLFIVTSATKGVVTTPLRFSVRFKILYRVIQRSIQHCLLRQMVYLITL